MATRLFELGAIDEVGRRVHVVASTRNPVTGFEIDPKTQTQIPRLEALESWDLERYAKNNVVLWQHDATRGAIGWGEEVLETERGLEMWIRFAAASEEPRAEEAWKRVKAKLIRAVSVGFEFGERTDEQRDGEPVAVFRNNSLHEVSLVTIPADPNALMAPRSDAAGETVRRFDYGKIGKVRRTALGGVVAPARLTRTGVLEYHLGDGKIRRELRLPEEVFHQDSLDSLADVPVTDIAHHRGFVDTTNFKNATLGHTTAIRHDDKYVEGDLHINDARAVVEVESKRLVDVSCGYQCNLEYSPGEWNGERYDAIQRSIRYNHVAVLPPGRGRAGTDVGIRLDANDAESVEIPTPEEITMKVIRIDGKDVEFGSEQHISHIEGECARQVKAAQEVAAKAVTDRDAAQAKFDAAERAAKKSTEEAQAELEKEKKARAAAIKSRVALISRAMEYVDEEEEGKEKKADAFDDLSDREIMMKVIRSDSNFDGFDDTGKSDEVVQAIYDAVIAKPVQRKDGVDNVVRVAEKMKREDARDEDTESKAQAEMRKRHLEASRKPIGIGLHRS